MVDDKMASVIVLSPMGKKKLTRLLARMDVLGFVQSMYLAAHVCSAAWAYRL